MKLGIAAKIATDAARPRVAVGPPSGLLSRVRWLFLPLVVLSAVFPILVVLRSGVGRSLVQRAIRVASHGEDRHGLVYQQARPNGEGPVGTSQDTAKRRRDEETLQGNHGILRTVTEVKIDTIFMKGRQSRPLPISALPVEQTRTTTETNRDGAHDHAAAGR